MLKRICTSRIFPIIITIIAINLNWDNGGFNYGATFFNFIVTVFYLLGWILFSFFSGRMNKKSSLKFLCIYWGISSITIIKTLFTLYFHLWYWIPIYGLKYILTNKYNITLTDQYSYLPTLAIIIATIISSYFVGRHYSLKTNNINSDKKGE